MLGRIWGRSLQEMARPSADEIKELGSEFKDLLRDFPFQVPQDFIYLGRAVGMLSGLTSQLHPEPIWTTFLLSQLAAAAFPEAKTANSTRTRAGTSTHLPRQAFCVG